MLQLQSIQREQNRQANFRPPYCPNPGCAKHKRPAERFYCGFGWSRIKRFPYRTRRYLCRECGQTFGYTFFFLDHREQAWGLNETIFTLYRKGVSMREIARTIGHDERLVRGRIVKMSRFAALRHAYLARNLLIQETIVYDGLENFAYSQYDPNNINHAVGQESLFVYDFNFAPLNRKGRMSPRQRRMKQRLEQEHGPYPRDAIRTATRQIVQRLYARCPTKRLHVLSDQHLQYRRALEDLAGLTIRHATVPSKIYRNYRNRLFAVNHLDMLSRHSLSAFKRETIAASKHSIAMQESFMLFVAFKNYMRPRFLKQHKHDPFSNRRSPAMHLGLTHKVLAFREFFQNRVTIPQVRLSEDWANLVRRLDPHSRRPIASYNGI